MKILWKEPGGGQNVAIAPHEMAVAFRGQYASGSQADARDVFGFFGGYLDHGENWILFKHRVIVSTFFSMGGAGL